MLCVYYLCFFIKTPFKNIFFPAAHSLSPSHEQQAAAVLQLYVIRLHFFLLADRVVLAEQMPDTYVPVCLRMLMQVRNYLLSVCYSKLPLWMTGLSQVIANDRESV